jgi:predicted nucleic acid-binding Zn ribbon protein
MPTYVYETIPQKQGDRVRRFEFQQSMQDAPLKEHPATGEPVQRIIAGSVGILTGKSSAPAQREDCCGGQGGPDCHCMCDN